MTDKTKKKITPKTVVEKDEVLFFGAFRIPLIKNKGLEDCYGRYKSLPDPKIEYNGCTGVTKDSTVFHEMLHFISDQFELDLSESQVRILEHAVPQMIRENPDQFKLILER